MNATNISWNVKDKKNKLWKIIDFISDPFEREYFKVKKWRVLKKDS